MDEHDEDRKRTADERAFVRLVGRLDQESIHVLLRLARAMQRGDTDAAISEAEARLRALADGVTPGAIPAPRASDDFGDDPARG